VIAGCQAVAGPLLSEVLKHIHSFGILLRFRMPRETHMKTVSVLICLIAATAPIRIARAASITNGDFSAGDFTGWTCPGGDCSVLNDDPYWMRVDNTHPAPGEAYSAHIGAWDVNNPGYIEQNNLGTTATTTYKLTFSYGEFNNFEPYDADPSMPQTNGIDVYWDDEKVYSASDFFLDTTTTHAGDGFFTAVSVNVTSASVANADDLKIYAHDTLQDVILTDISIAEGSTGALAPITMTRQVIDGQWADTQVASAPEPGTSGCLAIACGVLLLLPQRKRSMRANALRH